MPQKTVLIPKKFREAKILIYIFATEELII
jgi:hypothetical protein